MRWRGTVVLVGVVEPSLFQQNTDNMPTRPRGVHTLSFTFWQDSEEEQKKSSPCGHVNVCARYPSFHFSCGRGNEKEREAQKAPSTPGQCCPPSFFFPFRSLLT